MTRLTLLGVGAMKSPRYAPAGLLLEHRRERIMFDGGTGAAPSGPLNAWLVTDTRSECIRAIRGLAFSHRLEPEAEDYVHHGLAVHPLPVVHTSHPTFGYRIDVDGYRIVWAPEFLVFPEWAAGADLLFGDAAGWDRPIRFVGGVGGHAAALDVAEIAREYDVKRLILAHIGRPTIRAMDAGKTLPFGCFGHDGDVLILRRPARRHALGPVRRPHQRSAHHA